MLDGLIQHTSVLNPAECGEIGCLMPAGGPKPFDLWQALKDLWQGCTFLLGHRPLAILHGGVGAYRAA